MERVKNRKTARYLLFVIQTINHRGVILLLEVLEESELLKKST